jgi:hypothetical protein
MPHDMGQTANMPQLQDNLSACVTAARYCTYFRKMHLVAAATALVATATAFCHLFAA